ncbi:MAG: hypothetical protein ACSLE6_06445 [Mycobacterium sp.]
MIVDGVGPQLDDNGVRGWLAFEYLPPDLHNAEDSTLAADADRWSTTVGRGNFTWPGRKFDRPATDTERILLQHIGFTDLPGDLSTRVEFVASGVRRRTWPQLETEGNA